MKRWSHWFAAVVSLGKETGERTSVYTPEETLKVIREEHT
jgi:hypothetical protein